MVNEIHAEEVAKLSQANEDYLEAIVILANSTEVAVRSVDIANKLGVSKPSVNNALTQLRNSGYIRQEPYGGIYLTEAGLAYGRATYERHLTLTRFFHEVLGVEGKRAEEEACCIEHIISEDTFERWSKHVREQLGDEQLGK